MELCLGDEFLGGIDLFAEQGKLLLLGGIGNSDDGIGIAAAAVGGSLNGAAFGDVVEEGEERIEVLLGEGIVLVIVAAAATLPILRTSGECLSGSSTFPSEGPSGHCPE